MIIKLFFLYIIIKIMAFIIALALSAYFDKS